MHGRRRLALLGERSRRARATARAAAAAQLLELGVVEVVEEVDRPQIGDVTRRVLTPRPGTGGSSETAIEPSPTALATRLIERARTSPATNTPGTLVSSRNGSRVERPAGGPATSGPARMKPRSSRATTPSSQSVRGARADEDEARVDAPATSRSPSAPRDQRAPPGGRRRARRRRAGCSVRDLDVRQRRDLLDQVVRHELASDVAADEHRHLRRVAAEVARPPGRPSWRRR